MSLWINRSDGTQSASITFATIAFVVTTLWLIASVFIKIGPVTIRPFDGGTAMMYLTPILALYFGRRQTESMAAAALTVLPSAPSVVAPTTTSGIVQVPVTPQVSQQANLIGSNSSPAVVGSSIVSSTSHVGD